MSHFKESDDGITIRLSRTEFNGLLLVLGMALANAGGESLLVRKVVNMVNDGNQNFTPFYIPLEPPK